MRARGGERVLRLLVWGGPEERGSEARLSLGIVGTGKSAFPARIVPTDEWSWVEFQLSSPLRAGEVRLALEASTFVPRAVMTSGDGRELGVGFRQLEIA